MTVVAGALTSDLVLMAADCRVTVPRPNAEPIVADNAQKILQLGRHSVVGFAGDLRLANFLLCHLLGRQLQRRRLDGASVRRWLPRYMRATYQSNRRFLRGLGKCWFLVGSTARRNARVQIDDVLRRPRDSNITVQNWLALRIAKDLNNPSGFAEVPDSSTGFLYTMESPEFEPQDCKMMEFSAIGSGSAHIEQQLARYQSLIMLDSPDLGIGWFTEAIARGFAEMTDPYCGGLFLVAALCGGEVHAMLPSASQPGRGIEVFKEGARFVQQDHTRRVRITLRPPWEIDVSPPRRSVAFPHYRESWDEPGALAVRRLPDFITPERRAWLEDRAQDTNKESPGK